MILRQFFIKKHIFVVYDLIKTMLPQPTILTIPPKKFIGQRLKMSFANNQTFRLWNTFMLRRNEITNAVHSNLYNIQMYSERFFQNFNPTAEFEKWAAVEVDDFTILPEGMEALTITGGQYAVFNYKGTGEVADEVYGYIFQEWLPKSGYKLAVRPHFEVLGKKYRHGDPNSEEEIWIPVS
jgi:AraC family transcriptional regulator